MGSGLITWGRRLFNVLKNIADEGWSATAVFAYGLLQNLMIPGLSDAMFLPLSLASPKQAWKLAAAAAAGTVVGASILFWSGAQALDLLSSIIPSAAPSSVEIARIESLLNKWGWLLILVSTFSPLSTKLLAASSGAFGMSYIVFIAALAAGRIVRVSLLAWAITKFGAKAVREALGLEVENSLDSTPVKS